MNAIRIIALMTGIFTASTSMASTIEIEVNGLVCAFCAQGIQKSLKKFPEAKDVLVNLEHRLVAVEVGDEDIADEALRKAITKAGYATVKIQRSDDSIAAIRNRIEGEKP